MQRQSGVRASLDEIGKKIEAAQNISLRVITGRCTLRFEPDIAWLSPVTHDAANAFLCELPTFSIRATRQIDRRETKMTAVTRKMHRQNRY